VAAHTGACEACREKWGLDELSLQLHLAADEAAAHVDVHDAVMARLGSEAGETVPIEPPARMEAGKRVGGYEILEKLGSGGMGTVFKARQLNIDRIVALKILPEALAQDEASLKRFTREARAAAAASHPNIVEVHDIGQDGATHYIAMEFVDGESLADAIRREGRLAPERALEVMTQVTAAIAEAHDRGVLHRDIKPSNILLTKKGRVKVADFGLAKRLGADVTITETGQPLGTPLYLPPEVARGEPFDRRSDLYSLGATFYHALAGRPPYEGRNATEVALKQVQGGHVPLGQAVPGVPPALCEVVERLLKTRPLDRYQDAREVFEALGRAGMEIKSCDATRAGRRRADRSLILRKTRSVLLLLAAAASVAVMVCATWWAVAPGRGDGRQPSPTPGASRPLFRGGSLEGWRVLGDGKFSECGSVRVRGGSIHLEAGKGWTGVALDGAFPTERYEVIIEARRLSGQGDFCDVLFPVGSSSCLLVVGALQGAMGLALVNDQNVPDNPTVTHHDFSDGQWYQIRLRVDDHSVEVLLGGDRVVHVDRGTCRLAAWEGFDALRPFGICAWQTATEIRRVELGHWVGD
jgi:predicted Ser/Thr protein kinase